MLCGSVSPCLVGICLTLAGKGTYCTRQNTYSATYGTPTPTDSTLTSGTSRTRLFCPAPSTIGREPFLSRTLRRIALCPLVPLTRSRSPGVGPGGRPADAVRPGVLGSAPAFSRTARPGPERDSGLPEGEGAEAPSSPESGSLTHRMTTRVGTTHAPFPFITQNNTRENTAETRVSEPASHSITLFTPYLVRRDGGEGRDDRGQGDLGLLGRVRRAREAVRGAADVAWAGVACNGQRRA